MSLSRTGLPDDVIEFGIKLGGYDFPYDLFQLNLVLNALGYPKKSVYDYPELWDNSKCDCGATTVNSNHPSHANWCTVLNEPAE